MTEDASFDDEFGLEIQSNIPDDAKPHASKPIESPSAASRKLKSNTKVSEDSGKPESVENGDVPYRTLLGLQSIHPFTRYFQNLADKEHKESANSSTRFRKHKENHRKLWWTCVVFDLLIIGVIWTLILVGLSLTVYKTLIL